MSTTLLRSCQQEAFDCAKTRIENGENESNLSLCTGAGKTHVITMCSTKIPLLSRSMLIFPSLLLLEQYYRESHSHYEFPMFYLATEGTLRSVPRLSEMLKELNEPKWCILTTYRSAPTLISKFRPTTLPDVIIHDEAHHIQEPLYAAALNAANMAGVKRINLSATLPDSKKPHYKYPLLKGIQDGVVRDFNMDLFLCVDKERQDGATALLELIVRKLITQHEKVKLLIYTREANTDSDDASSVHMFLKTHRDALRANGWWMEGIKEDTVDRKTLLREFEQNKSTVSILVSCRTLSEGIDLKGANCMLPWDPTSSIVDNIQRIGRVLRLYKDSHGNIKEKQPPSTVIIPVFLPEVEYLACDKDRVAIDVLLKKQIEAGERGNFRPIVNVCTALKSELADEDAELFNALLYYPHTPKVTVDNTLLDCVAKACKKPLDVVKEEIAVTLDEGIAAAVREGEWNDDDAGEVVNALVGTQRITLVIREEDEVEMYGNGSQVITVEKHANGEYKTVKNGTKKAQSKLEDDAKKRVAHRLRVNFSDECQIILGIDSVEGADTTGGLILKHLTSEVKVDENWEARRLEWIAMHQRLGRNPSQTSDDFEEKRAAIWQSNQRAAYRKNALRMTKERIDILNNATPRWDWEEPDYFEHGYAKWKRYVEINKKLPLERDGVEEYKWQSWIRRKYRGYQEYSLTKEQINILNSNEYWRWEDDRWGQQYDNWVKCRNHCGKNPSKKSTFDNEKRAGNWQCEMRKLYNSNVNSSKLTPERIKLLNDTQGWSWIDDKWNEQLQHWVSEVNKLNRLPLSTSIDANEKKAAQWQSNQRSAYKREPRASHMTHERITILNVTPRWLWSEKDTPATQPQNVIEHVAADSTHVRNYHPPATVSETKETVTARQRSALEMFHTRFKTMNADTYASTIAENPEDFFAYHDIADKYDARDPPERQPLVKIASLLSRFNRPSYKAIDLGCGRNTLRTMESVNRMTWTSVDVHTVDNTVTVANMGALPYEDECYDIAVLSRSLWARNHLDVICETHRILKVGGRIVICEARNRWLADDKRTNTLLPCLVESGFEIQYKDGTEVTDDSNDVFQYIVAVKK
jgi:hypothetical protein